MTSETLDFQATLAQMRQEMGGPFFSKCENAKLKQEQRSQRKLYDEIDKQLAETKKQTHLDRGLKMQQASKSFKSELQKESSFEEGQTMALTAKNEEATKLWKEHRAVEEGDPRRIWS